MGAASLQTTGRESDPLIDEAERDCFAIGDYEGREACFARYSDAEIADCEQNSLFACAPYKEMHAARIALSARESSMEANILQLAMQAPAGYAASAAAGFRAANAAWRGFRDSECEAEQYLAGTNPGRLFGDLVEACRLRMTKERIAAFEKLQDVVALQAIQPDATYPNEIQGHWMPVGMGCASVVDGTAYDGELLLHIDETVSGTYENTAKPLAVRRIGREPATWQIRSTFSPGTAEYDGDEVILFTLDGDRLTVDSGILATTYVRCG